MRKSAIAAAERTKKRWIAAGRCKQCGKPRGDSPFANVCRYHGLKRRLYHQRWSGHIPKKGGRGRGAPLKDIPIRDMAQLEKMRERGEL